MAINNIKKIFETEESYEHIIKDYKKKYDKKIIASPYYFIPPEINAAFNIVTLKIPEFMLSQNSRLDRLHSIFDAIVISDRECFCNKDIKSIEHYIFRTPEGFGEDAAVALHNEIALMLNTLFSIEIKSINIESLQRETAVYENLRRSIRNISSIRAEKRVLSNDELALIFETALTLPAELAIQYINPVLDPIKTPDTKDEDIRIRSLLYGKKNIPDHIADHIERIGISIAEDDLCTGRRSFDISLNAESEYIFYELLDAYSYRSLFPCLRPVNERYELIYKLLRNYQIDCVIFYKDEDCHDLNRDIDYLRIKMMRDGIDPLVIGKDNYEGVVSEYMKKSVTFLCQL
ncbi:MAG: 2-hydroxyacyl-CoA dehydratase family protein [Leptospirales bacterium]|nr:2-hydroxyacyl-CoA dehydratase family protein [Leptospirales bacterium]